MGENKEQAKPQKKPHEPRDVAREVLETIVFVVVLVLMLQLFVAQAFVIPTGSMATTLYGNYKAIECEQCGYEFAINASREVEEGHPVTTYVCPNCRHRYTGPPSELPDWEGGDRVIVLKLAYDAAGPERFQVPVFKYPVEPMAPDWERKNFIKRLVGFPGETIAIAGGDLYMTRTMEYPAGKSPPPDDPLNAWQPEYMYQESDGDREVLRKHDFRILRRSPSVMLEMRRIVYDNDHQAPALTGKVPPRWWADGGAWPKDLRGWEVDEVNAPKVFTYDGTEPGWIRYHHLVPEPEVDPRTGGPVERGWAKAGTGRFEPQLIRNFLGYNYDTHDNYNTDDWVGDLYVECEAEVLGEQTRVTLEVAEGRDRFQAVFDAAEGSCTLYRLTRGREPVGLASADVPFRPGGSYDLRLANVDDRLTVWVDSDVIDFGGDADYAPPGEPATYEDEDDKQQGWVRENDIMRPARVGVQGHARISGLKVWRDTYYTNVPPSAGTKVNTYYVQPGHYLCFGDNSSSSADSRNWGLVPERLLIGRALLVYYPLSRIGLIE